MAISKIKYNPPVLWNSNENEFYDGYRVDENWQTPDGRQFRSLYFAQQHYLVLEKEELFAEMDESFNRYNSINS